MDRQIVYPGSIPLDTDLLSIQRNVQAAIGALARAVLGDAPLVDGMACVPAATPYSVSIGAGSYTALLPSDWSPFGSLPADPTPVVRTGLLLGDTMLTLGGPPDAGSVLCWLVQAAIAEVDTGPVALPYWNAANPNVAFSGPANNGLAQNTQRVVRVLLTIKSTAPQPAPIGIPPQPDPGSVGLFAVTTFFGKPGIEAADIVTFADAPRLRFQLPVMPPGYSQQSVYTASTQWMAPDRVRLARVRVVGAGGGGGGGDLGYSGGGGGAGGYAEALIALEPRQAYSVVVGQGGGGGGPNATGGGGGNSSFGGTLAAASGGQGGASSNPDSHGGSPGFGTAGGVLQFGGCGGDGAIIASVPAGMGGASAFGGGGRGANQGGAPANGMASGSGGGGGYGAQSSGGVGQLGIVIIEY